VTLRERTICQLISVRMCVCVSCAGQLIFSLHQRA